MDNFRTEVDEHGNIKVTSYVEAVVISKEEQEQALRILKQLQEENDKLREQVTRLRDDWESERDYADQMEAKEKRAVSENAKLRELGGEVASILFNLDVDRCSLCKRDDISHPCQVHTAKGGECPIKSELRELGVEVKS